MIGPVTLGGKYWAHNGECSIADVGPHIHYGRNITVGVDPKMVPEDVLDEYYMLFGNPAVAPPQGVIDASDVVMMETTDAPPYETTAMIPKPRKRKPKKRPKPPPAPPAT